jgi:hypothetical protein
MVYPGGGRNHLGMAYIDNLVEGVILAAIVPAATGRLYHITDGEEVTCREVLDAVAGALGVPPPRRSVPFPVVYAIAALLEGRESRHSERRRRSRLRRPPGGLRLPLRHRQGAARARYRPVVSFRRGGAPRAARPRRHGRRGRGG